MKGQKLYNLAKSQHEKMHERSHTMEEQVKLHIQYFELIKRAAYNGHLESQYAMGNLHEDIGYLGIPNPMYNPKRAVYWYAKACERGHSEACNNLASLYELGIGCRQNLDMALNLYSRSSDWGSPNGKKNYKIMLKDFSKGGKYNK